MSPPNTPVDPFPGLRPFEPEESHLFFGRDSQRQELINRLWDTRFLAVVGTSGGGKSSLVRAGLLPALQSGMMSGAGSAWRFAIMRPGSNPIRNLAAALSDEHCLVGEQHTMFSTDRLENDLKRSSLGLVNVVSEARCQLNNKGQPLLDDDENLLILVDQFEELFRFNRLAAKAQEREHASSFVTLLMGAAEQERVPLRLYIALTMRSEYLGESARFPGLAEAINRGEYLIPRMSRDERRAAIVGPVAVGGGAISEALVNELLNDMGDDPDQLPVLQHALMRTWEEWKNHGVEGERLEVQHYTDIGRMTTALAKHAEATLDEFCDPLGNGKRSDDRIRIAERVFKALTELGPDNRPIRHPAALGNLIKITQAPAQEVFELLDIFRKPGRSFLMPPLADPLEPDKVIDISHESLLRIWEQLKTWTLQEATAARIYRRLAEAATLYESGKEPLLRDPALQIALDWQRDSIPNAFWAARYHDGYESAIRYLEQSEKARDQEIKKNERQRQVDLREEAERGAQVRFANRLRRLLSLAIGVGVVAVLFAIGFGVQSRTLRVKTNDLVKASKELTEAKEALEKNKGDLEQKLIIGEKLTNDLANQTIELDKTVKQRDSALGRIIPNALGLQALNKFSSETRSGIPIALQSILVARQTRSQAVPLEASSDPEVYGALQRAVQIVKSDPMTNLESTVSMELPDRGHSARVQAFSPDGTRLVTGGDDGVVQVLDAEYGQLLLKLQYPGNSRVLGVAFTSDGRRIMAVGSDGLVMRWSALSGGEEPVQLDSRDTLGAESAVLAEGATRYAMTDSRGNIKKWEVSGGNRRALPVKITCSSGKIAISPNGEVIACGETSPRDFFERDESGIVKIDPPVGVSSFRIPFKSLKMLVFSPNSQQLLVVAGEGSTALYDVAAGRPIWESTDKGVRSASFGWDGKIIVTGRDDGTVIFQNARTGKLLHKLQAISSSIELLTVSRNGRRFAASGKTGESTLTKLWEFPIASYPEEGTSLAFSSDGRMVAIGARTGTVRVMFVGSGRELLTLRAHDQAVISMAFSPKGDRLATGFADGLATVWNIWSGKEVFPRIKAKGNDRGDPNVLHSVAFSPDGQRLVTGDEWGNIEIWDAENGRRYTGNSEQAPAAIYSIAFGRDGEGLRLISGSEAGVAVIFAFDRDKNTLKVLSATRSGTARDWNSLLRKERITKVALAQDGKHFMTIRRTKSSSSALEDVVAEVWNGQTPIAKREFEVPKKPVAGADFSEDKNDRKLITVAGDGTVQIWGGRNWKETVVMQGPQTTDGVVFDGLGKLFAAVPKNEPLGVFAFDQDLPINWSLTQINQSPTRDECARYLRDTAEECRRFVEALDKIASANGYLTKRGSPQKDWPQAIELYTKAQEIYPALPKDLSNWIKKFVAELLLAEARNELRVGNKEKSLAYLRDAQRYDRTLVFTPDTVFERYSRELADDKNRILADVQKAKLEAKRLAATSQITKGIDFARAGKITESLREFSEAQKLDPKVLISPDSSDVLCWFASLHGYASAVVDDACDKGVQRAKELGDIAVSNYDSRGVARALVGRTKEAIEDFREYVEKSKNSASAARRQRWIQELTNGKNPFTPEEIEALKRE